MGLKLAAGLTLAKPTASSWKITGAPGTGDDLLYSQAGTPTLDLRFASSKSLNDNVSGQNLITFTRSGNATYFDADGVIQTAGTNTARFDHDPETGESLGLLIEESRANLLLNSETLATQDVTVTATAHTLSFYGTGTVTLSGTHSATVVGTGAYPTRTTLTFTPTAGTLTVTVSGTVQYANLEIGSFATSWIPTAGTTVTRNADVAQITGSNFSRWYSQSQGTVFADVASYGSRSGGFNVGIATFSDNTANNFIGILANKAQPGGPVVQPQIYEGGSATYRPDLADDALNTKAALGYQTNNAYAVLNNGNDSLDNTVVIPTVVDRLDIGNFPANRFMNGSISRLAYFNRRLPDATLQAITAS